MAIMRVHKTQNYTVMSNTHLRDKNLSLKAKGLLSMMLTMPDDWKFSVAGLVSASKEDETAIKSGIRELKENGYVVVTKKTPKETASGRYEYEYDIYENKIQAQNKQGLENQYVEYLPVEHQPIEEGGLYKYTEIPNTEILNTEIQSTKSSLKKEYKESPQDHDFTAAVVDYLNEKAGTHYRAGVAKTRELIKARVNEGFSEADFRTVIDKKCADWIGTEYEQYLRPQTLFGTKFESYLNGVPYSSKCQTQKKRPANVPDWVPDEVVNQPDFKCMDTMLNYPSYGIVTYVTTAGQYGTWEPETKERADKIQRDYNEWLNKKGGEK